MDVFVHPRLADHAQGLELRIIELSHRIERAQRWPGSSAHLAALERQRRMLFQELAETTASRDRLPPVRVDGRRVDSRRVDGRKGDERKGDERKVDERHRVGSDDVARARRRR